MVDKCQNRQKLLGGPFQGFQEKMSLPNSDKTHVEMELKKAFWNLHVQLQGESFFNIFDICVIGI